MNNVTHSGEFSQDAFEKAVNHRVPYVASILLERWNCIDWSFEKFSDLYGDKIVSPSLGLPKSGIYKKEHSDFIKQMKLSDFFETMGDSISYLSYLRPSDLDHGLLNDLNFSALTASICTNTNVDTRLWIGSKNTHSGLHSDLMDNIFIQVSGEKILYLVPFSETKNVYPFVDNIVNSMVDPAAPDFKKFPKFSAATVSKIVLKRGDLVFIPRGWWHCLISQSPSISVNHWFGKQISSSEYLHLIFKQGFSHVFRMLSDAVKYGILRYKYKENFFHSPPSNGQRLVNFIRTGNFSNSNNPVKNK